jgi:hypothetical protein
MWNTTSKPRPDLLSAANLDASPPDRLKQMKAEFELMMEQGVIRPSPLHVVSKKDDGLQPYGDYRALNALTVSERYSPPHIEDLLYNKRIFSKIDLIRAYYQMPIAPENFEKPAIVAPFGLFEAVNVMFGLRNAA